MLKLLNVKPLRRGHADGKSLDGVQCRRRDAGAAGEGHRRPNDGLDLHRPAESVLLQDRGAMVGLDALRAVAHGTLEHIPNPESTYFFQNLLIGPLCYRSFLYHE